MGRQLLGCTGEVPDAGGASYGAIAVPMPL